MSYIFHVTATLGRADSMILEADSLNDIKSLFSAISVAVLTNVKKIVYSKDLNINYSKKTFIDEPYYHTVNIFVKTDNFASVIKLFNVKKSVTDSEILSKIQALTVNDERIIDVYNIQRINER